ncbi:MAG: leucine dehydrogenase [Kiritimatiellae bacterium]|nr:leucine dehydrogenase [Kiritimatiellia bacterium]
MSKSMSLKAACAKLPIGGAKGVILCDPKYKNREFLEAYATCVHSLEGKFYTGEDINMSPSDVDMLLEFSPYFLGASKQQSRYGMPAKATALGVVSALKSAVNSKLQKNDLKSLKVAIQGLGSVGLHLAKHLAQAGCQVYGTDIDVFRVQQALKEVEMTIVGPDQWCRLDVDVLSPCAIGGTINNQTIPLMKASIIVGSANNQLENEVRDARSLHQRDILYCPDFIASAGGIINVYAQLTGYDRSEVMKKIDMIGETLRDVVHRTKQTKRSIIEVAQKMAHEYSEKALEAGMSIPVSNQKGNL